MLNEWIDKILPSAPKGTLFPDVFSALYSVGLVLLVAYVMVTISISIFEWRRNRKYYLQGHHMGVLHRGQWWHFL